MKSFPTHVTERYLEPAKAMTLYGVRLTDLTRDELLAAAAMGWTQHQKALEELRSTARARAAAFVRGL